MLESIRVRSGSNHGKSWRLFSYRAFESQPNSGIDPVVVGLTFAAANESNGFLISGDMSGESLGDVIFEIPRQEAYGSMAIIAAARDMCRKLIAGSQKVGAALRDSSRRK